MTPTASTKETPMPKRTVAQALKKFKLIQGSSGDGEKTACETSLLGWIWGEEDWGDALPCAHPIIRDLMVGHNDDGSTTQEQREEAVRLGMTGALDTWWVPGEVVAVAQCQLPKGAEATRHDRLVALLTFVAEWKKGKERPNLRSADLRSANLRSANLQFANLQFANLRSADLRSANLQFADLQSANLRSADLQSANLQFADLRSADLRSANLQFADLQSALTNEYTKLPDGWFINEAGLIVKAL